MVNERSCAVLLAMIASSVDGTNLMRRRLERLIASLAVTSLLWVGFLNAAAFAQDGPPSTASSPDVMITPDGDLPEISPVGQPLILKFTIDHPRDAVLIPPEETGSSRFMLSESNLTPLTTPEGGTFSSSLALTLLPLRAGTAPLGGLELGVASPDGTSLTLPLLSSSIKFTSTLADDQANVLRSAQPPKVIKQEDYTPLKIAGGVAGALAMLALVALGAHALKPPPEPPKPPPIDVVALDALRALEGTPLETEPALVAFYTQMSEVLRDYFGKRYDFPGTEYTTSEILEALPVVLLPPSLGVSEIASWLRRSDRVKFSSSRPDPDEAHADLRQAMAMVELTRPLPEEPEEVSISSDESASSPEDSATTDDMDSTCEEPAQQDEPEVEQPSGEEAEDELELAASALGTMSWDELSEMVDELDDEEE